jgi:hypothetical protein
MNGAFMNASRECLRKAKQSGVPLPMWWRWLLTALNVPRKHGRAQRI